jgi:predicted RNA binding protein YcfA (HicA-like mRNA interferase family)
MAKGKLPRDLSGEEITWSLRRLGFAFVRQRGSHIRLERMLDVSPSQITATSTSEH